MDLVGPDSMRMRIIARGPRSPRGHAMKRNRWMTLALMVVCAWTTSSNVRAAPPWQKMIPFKRIEADPNKPYPLSADNGPWLIMAATFSGEQAREQAQELVHELRSRYKLPAFTYEVIFDYTQPTEFRGVNRYGAAKRGVYANKKKIDEFAVLVGEFSSVDDSAAQKTLEKIKKAPIDCMDLNKRQSKGKKDYRSLGNIRSFLDGELDKLKADKGVAVQDRGPLARAFLTANPLIPKEYFAPKQGIDKFVLELNEDLEYSLLKCPGRYTVKVATFNGRVEIDQNKIKKELTKPVDYKDSESPLRKAALMAHTLTLALRKKGYEAYEFHDRFSSIVAVGSFNSTGTPRADGKTEINPAAYKLMQTFGAEKQQNSLGQMPGVVQAKTFDGIPCDAQPVLVHVPQRSIAADYDRARLSQR